MTEKRKKSHPDPASLALEAANQALTAANAAVQAAVKALALTRREKEEDDAARRGRGSIRSAASQARRGLANTDADGAGVAPLASTAPARRAAKPKPAPPAPEVPQPKAIPRPKATPAPRPVAPAPTAEPVPSTGGAFAARKRGTHAEPPVQTPPPGHDTGSGEQRMEASPQVPESQAQERPSGSGPIILGAGAAITDAPRDQSPAAPAPLAPAGPSEAELQQREAEVAEREAAMARYEPMEPAHPVPARPQAEDNGFTVLVVDDEEQVRALTVRILSRFGYRVLEASGVELALSILDQDSSNVDLVLSDVAMPGLSGKDLFRAISESRPGLPVVFMSGYALGVYAPEGLIEEGVKMLPKPFGQDDLLDFVTEALQGAGRAVSG
jgi:CheY-like chemotaxis protein